MEQWILVGALITCLFLLLNYESRKGGAKLSPRQLVNLVNREEAVVVDLRDSAEFKKGHIVDSINVPYTKLAEHWQLLESHRDKPLLLVCKMGQHSGAVGKQLMAKGFDKVYRLDGGMMEWQQEQLPLVK